MRLITAIRNVMVMGTLVIISSFTLTRHGSSITTYKFYAFPLCSVPNTIPNLPSLSQVLMSLPALIYVTSSDLTISQALNNTPVMDFCSSDSDYICAVKVRDINGFLTVIQAVEGDYYVL